MNIQSYIDYTILKPEASEEEIYKICEEAKEDQCASVCVNTYYVKLVSELLRGSGVKTCCGVGFPLGATTIETKVFETKQALENGAHEIDMVMNIGALKDKKYNYVKKEIKEIAEACHSQNAILKVIIEACLLTDDEKIKICELAVEAGADYVKTSTGFSTSGAKATDIRLMKDAVRGKAKVKAAGGIRDYHKAKEMLDNGADRVGTSVGYKIVRHKV